MKVEGNGWEMHLGDAFSIVPTLTGVDVVIADPPYGMRLDASYKNSSHKTSIRASVKKGCRPSRGYKHVEGDHEDFDPSPLFACLHNVPEQLWFGADYYRAHLPPLGSWIVWDKREGLEDMQYSSSEFELCWSRARHHRKVLRHRWHGLCGTETQDVRGRVHPTQKPIELMLSCVDIVSDKGETVLDPFAGSGTTGVACIRLGRKFIGIEKDRAYFDLACDRLRASSEGSTLQAQRSGQTALFAATPSGGDGG